MKQLTEQKLQFQRLVTGHLAPYEDEDIRKNIELAGKFPHAPIVTGRIGNEYQHPYDGIPELNAIPKGTVVLDVGAFIGDNTLEFLSYGWRVIAFEPFPDAYACLCHNSPRSVNIMAAVGNGETVRLDYDCPGTNHGMRQTRLQPEGMPTLRIDDLPLSEVGFIKVDCEGHEKFVLHGALDTIRKFHPLLYVEVWTDRTLAGDWTAAELAEFLESIGYEYRPVGHPPRLDWFCFPATNQTHNAEMESKPTAQIEAD